MNYFNGYGKSDDKKNRNSVIDDKIYMTFLMSLYGR